MKLAEFSVKNSLLVNLVSLFILAAGLFAMFQLPREAFPNVTFDIVTVTTSYPGAPTEDVEKFVTIPIEKELKGISGIKDLESSSDEGLSLIGITIDPEASDKERVVQDIKDAVDRVRDLPEGVEEEPLVVELKSSEYPILEISISGDFSESEKRQYAETLEDLILDVDGVASVRRIGWRDREFWVEIDPRKMAEYYVSVDEIVEALQTRNVTLPGGQLTTPEREYDVRITGEFRTAEEIADVVIRANDAGNWLRVKDVATVKDTFEDQTRIAKINKERAVAMVVVATEKSDVIRLSNKVQKTIARFEEQLPEGMSITITNDFSYYVKRRLGVLSNNGMIGLMMVLGMLFLFLSPVPAFVTALGIPIALFSTFIAMAALGMSINLISMLGLIIVLGMIVDDGIIVAENTYRHIEQGMSPKEAAIRGVSEVIAPVTVTILTTMAAFAPLLFMKDILGKFIREIPIVVIIALTASLLEAFIILPAHISDVVSWSRKRAKRKRVEEKRWFTALKEWYVRFLSGALKYRYLFVIGIIVFGLFTGFVYSKFVKKTLFTDEGMEQFFIRAEAPKGTPLEKLNELIEPVEDIVARLPESELDSFRTYLGSIEEESGFDPNARRGTHLGQITVFLTPFQGRERTPGEITDEIREKLKTVQGFEKVYIYVPKPGPPVGRAVSVGLKGEQFGVLQEMAQKYIDYLSTLDGVTDIEMSYQFGKKQLKVVVDKDLARKYHLTVADIASTVRAAFRGSVATSVRPVKAEEEILVLVRFNEEHRSRLEAFEGMLISNKFDKLVPLKSVAKVVEEEGVYQINHMDGRRVIYVLANVNDKKITSLEVNSLLQDKFRDMENEYPGYSVVYSGEYEEQMETFRHLLVSFLFAFFAIFIILTAMFNSLLQPFIVMMAIPFGLIGVVWAFIAHGKPLNFFALMGVVGLTGIVVNDSIVLVDFINRERLSGKSRRESLLEAGQLRLRPVIMTTVTTIGGLVSVAYGIGGGDPFLKPMALAIVWGLLFATILTLVLIPCIYAIFDDLAEKLLHHALVRETDSS